MRTLLAFGCTLILAGCIMPPAMQHAQVGRGAPMAGPSRAGCNPQLMGQAEWVAGNLVRVQLGGTKPEVFAQLGQPQTMESFLLEGGQAVEVLFYPTPESACATGPSLPLVLQNNRLIGYGPTYYQQVIVPVMQSKAKNLPSPATAMQERINGTLATPKVEQTDLHNPQNTLPAGFNGTLGRGAPLK